MKKGCMANIIGTNSYGIGDLIRKNGYEISFFTETVQISKGMSYCYWEHIHNDINRYYFDLFDTQNNILFFNKIVTIASRNYKIKNILNS